MTHTTPLKEPDQINDVISQSSGSVTLVDLGTGTSFDVSSYPGYQNFTTDNFIVEAVSSSGTIRTAVSYQTPINNVMNYSGSNTLSVTLNKSYENGILTSNISCNGTLSIYQSITGNNLNGSSTANASITVHAYLIY